MYKEELQVKRIKHKPIVNIRKIKKINYAKENVRDKISDFLELPREINKNNIKITLVNNTYLYLEGNNKIEDYYEHYIKIKTDLNTIVIDGKKMEIKDIDDKEIMIEGVINNISYS